MKALFVTLLLVLTACAPNAAYRVKAPVLMESKDGGQYTLSFIEFDDMGEMFARSEFDAARAAIRSSVSNAAPGREPIVLIFIHGWKNNASDKSGNVWGFRDQLASVSRDFPGRPVLGVYLGWRGAVTSIPVVKELTFWNRRNAAIRIPGAHITDVLATLMRDVKGANGTGPALCIAIGHSFGGIVMERALTQAMVERLAIGGDTLQPPADLVVFVNEAGPAIGSKEFLDTLENKTVSFKDASGRDHPLFLSITSAGDTATQIAFPAGQFLSLPKTSLRKYDQPDEFGVASQTPYYLLTTANTEALRSHVIGTCAALGNPPNIYTSAQAAGKVFVVERKPGAKNTTPYWVMQMPVEFVPDHSTIFKPEFRALLSAFISPSPRNPCALATADAVPAPAPPPPAAREPRRATMRTRQP